MGDGSFAALPADLVGEVIPQLIRHGKVPRR
jgi:hypothetical protein